MPTRWPYLLVRHYVNESTAAHRHDKRHDRSGTSSAVGNSNSNWLEYEVLMKSSKGRGKRANFPTCWCFIRG
jgi:hypothetical protein